MSFELTILGSNSAAPAHSRHQSAQVLRIENQAFLIDCGEGTQMQIARYRIKLGRINHIFISHLHGDHYLGLVGLISTMHLRHRDQELVIFGPPGLNDIITMHLKYTEMVLCYKVRFVELDPHQPQLILENELLTVTSFPLDHRIPCTGFLFKETPKPYRLNKEMNLRELSKEELSLLKSGQHVTDGNGGIKYHLDTYTFPPKKARSYAYCSDTRYNEDIIPLIKGVDLLYHESTFLSDRQQRAHDTYHSTAREAAKIATQAQVERLILGHFSIRYRDLDPLLVEAKEVFSNSYLAVEGERILIEN